jgi:uncharacterized membrane protein (DUF2068 family)
MKAAAARRDLWARLRRELGREVQQPDLFVRFIIIERFARGVLLIIAGALLVLYHRRLSGIIRTLEVQFNLQTGQRFFQRVLEAGLERLGAVRPATAVLLGIGALVYAAIELTESIGLARRRRWAEYLTVLATAFFIPFELFEVLRHLTVLRVGALLLNVAIVVYLTWKKRLFVGE